MEEDLELGKQIGNHIGCMAGFFNIFDRPNLLSPKRFSFPKRLSSSPIAESQPASETTSPSPLLSKDLGNHKQDSRYSTPQLRSPAPESLSAGPDGNLTRSPLTLPVIEFKEGSRSPWRFSKEAPRLSLDSRAVVDAKGSLKPRQIRADTSGIPPMNRRDTTEGDNQRGSPSVIARLMGLEPLSSADSEQPQKSALKRSASESRVSRDYRFADSFNLQAQQSQNQQYSNSRNLLRDETVSTGDEVPVEFHLRSSRAQPARAPPQQRYVARRRSFFDSTDFFPDPKQCGLAQGDNEKVTNGFDGPPSDLETLKQLLEALRLKGLLHSSNKQQNGSRNRNLVFDHHESPIKPARLPAHLYQSRDSSLTGISSGGGARAVAAAASPSASPRLDRGTPNRSNARDHSKVRIGVSPKRNENSVKSPNRIPMLKEMPEQVMRVSPVTWRIPETVQTGNRANRCGGTEEQCSMGSRNSTIGSQSEEEIWKVKEYNREGKTLLERCDKLLNSIAEMTATAAEAEAEAGESQPSPVSVLDASLYHEDSSPSPVMKRTLDFTEQQMESEDDAWGGSMVSISSSSDESEYAYIFDILRATDCLPEDSDIFSLLEKQQYVRGKCASRAATQERRLIFDTVEEIVGRRKKLPPWRSVEQASVQVIWSEYLKIRKKRWSEEEEEDLVGFVCGVLGRDLREKEWRECEVEMSEAVLDIERLIFKDLIGETIGEVAAGVKRSEWGLQLQLQLQLQPQLRRRRLVF